MIIRPVKRSDRLFISPSSCLSVCLSPLLSVFLCLVVLLSVRWEQFDKNYLSKLLLRKSVYRKSELWEAYQKINIRDAISVIDQVKGTEAFHHLIVALSLRVSW